jgi:CheY-like chemotaxis protein
VALRVCAVSVLAPCGPCAALLVVECTGVQLRPRVLRPSFLHRDLSIQMLESTDASVKNESATATVLIVDDDATTTEHFARMLRLQGFRVTTALSAEEALRSVVDDHADAIILDLRMPLVDGLEFLRRLRRGDRQRTTPVAIVTGDYLIDDLVISELHRLGAEVRFKPLWLDDLVALTRTLIQR